MIDFVNINMSSTVPKADLAAAKQIAASLFFENVFGAAGGANGLNFLIALSAFGNLLAVFLGQSRLLRECGRYANSFQEIQNNYPIESAA